VIYSALIATLTTLSGCGKKKSTNTKLNTASKSEQLPSSQLVVDPLAEQNIICSGTGCHNGIVKVLNFNGSSSDTSCVGAVIGTNKIITTATCLGSIANNADSCENIFVKFQNNTKAIRCDKILERGTGLFDYNYLRKRDFTIIQLKDAPATSAFSLTPQPLAQRHYNIWSFTKISEKLSMIQRSNCLLIEPDHDGQVVSTNIYLTDSYKVSCPDKSKLQEGSLITNRYGDLIGLYSKGFKFFEPFIISLGCVKSEIFPLLDGRNCPVFDRDQTNSVLKDQLKNFTAKKAKVRTFNDISGLFRWKAFQYSNKTIYEPECYINYRKTRNKLKGPFLSSSKSHHKLRTYRLTIKNGKYTKLAQIESLMLDIVISSKGFKRNSSLEMDITQQLSKQDLASYINGQQIHRSHKLLKSCTQLKNM
jgi:hypothetical protein